MTRKKMFMSIETAKNIIDQIADYKAQHPEFQGYVKFNRAVFLHVMGEPMLHPSLYEIIQYGSSKGIVFNLVTNGTLLDEHHCDRLIQSDLPLMTISINTGEKEAFESSHPGITYEDYMLNIRKFVKKVFLEKRNKIKIELQYLVNKGVLDVKTHHLEMNAESMLEQIDTWGKYLTDMDKQSSIDFHKRKDLKEASENFLHPDNEQIEYRIRIAENIYVMFKSVYNFANIINQKTKKVIKRRKGYCPLGCPFNQLCFFADGNTTFCTLDYNNSINLGNINENSLSEIINSSKLNGIRMDMQNRRLTCDICRRCQGNH
jgi:radical SAM protein with 4Fe4S-binding SPASM domain